MEVNTILRIVGIFVVLVGIGALLKPSLARIINAPGGPRIKAIIAMITGIILIIVSFFISV